MNEELDMIPSIVWFKEITWGEYKRRNGAHLIDVEYSDDDLMALNIFGPKYDYQIQLKISALQELMKKRGIPSLGDTEA